MTKSRLPISVLAGAALTVVTGAGAALTPAAAEAAAPGPSPTGSQSTPTATVTTEQPLDVSSHPTWRSTSFRDLDAGAQVGLVCAIDGGRLGDGSTTWFALQDPAGGWVPSDSVAVDGGPVPTCGDGTSVTGAPTHDLKIHQAPGQAEETVGSLDRGQEIEISCRTSGSAPGPFYWYKLEGTLGWVSGDWISLEGDEPAFCVNL